VAFGRRSVYSLPVYARSKHANVLCGIYDFCAYLFIGYDGIAVDAGHQMKKDKVAFYMFLTIIGGLIFVGSQAWEWKNFIKGEYGAVETKGGSILQFVNSKGEND
jgi:hypothetical protein